MKNKLETGNYYPGIDGLRGLAVILVLIYHNFFYLKITWYGQFGVDLFFVISGFLITEILLKNISSAKYFTNFYGRRLMRIFPIYYLCLALIFFVLLLRARSYNQQGRSARPSSVVWQSQRLLLLPHPLPQVVLS